MKTTFFLLVAMALFIGCEKNITIPPPQYDSKVSIQSMLEPDSLPIVYFNRTVPYFDRIVHFSDLVIRSAQVKIQSSTSTDSLRLDSVYNKLYCEYDYYYKGSLPIQSNKMYTLIIKNGSDTYTATAQTNLLPSSIDSTSYTPKFNDIYGEHEGVIVYFKDVPTQTNYYRYEMLRYVDSSYQKASATNISVCLGKDTVLVHELGRSVYSDEGLSGQQIKIVIEPAYTHKAGVQGKVYMQSIDKNAFDFFNQLDQQKLAQFNPFVEPVFLKDGQFGSKAIGYFSAKVNSNPVPFVFPE
jgi:hypothetical protein